MNTRKAVFAGSWYPDTSLACEKEIKNFLKNSEPDTSSNKKYIGGIVPHAGWYFSGRIACRVIHALVEDIPPDVIVIFGMHLHMSSPCYIMTDGSWETPFGEIKIEKQIASELVNRFDFQVETARNYTQDNTIELQLPFIKYFFDTVSIVPLGVPPVESSLEIGKAVAQIAKDKGVAIKVIGSTDLTHYGSNYGFFPKGKGKKALDWVRNENDRMFIDAMVEMNPEKILKTAFENNNACCAGAAAASVAAAKHLGASKAEAISYSTSYDIRPDDSFVGYAGIVFE